MDLHQVKVDKVKPYQGWKIMISKTKKPWNSQNSSCLSKFLHREKGASFMLCITDTEYFLLKWTFNQRRDFTEKNKEKLNPPFQYLFQMEEKNLLINLATDLNPSLELQSNTDIY